MVKFVKINTGGLIAGSSDGYILINNRWKCNNTTHGGWYKISCNDSSWSAGKVENKRLDQKLFKNAEWIVDSSDCSGPYTFYCRKNLIGEISFSK